MTDQPPPIDPRTRADLVAQTTALAAAYSGWRPRPDGRPDPGVALVGVLARFAELVVQRVNRSLDRNYLAFLDLIGTRPVPPLPARVPLTFSLAEGSPVGALVPAGTQVSAAPAGDATGEVVFETETTLALPMKPLCREGCRGLCPVCGGNRNITACACETPALDSRWAALKDWAERSR